MAGPAPRANDSADEGPDAAKSRNANKKVYNFVDKNDTEKTGPPVPISKNFKPSDDNDSTKGKGKSILEEHGILIGKVIGSGNYAKVKMGYSTEYGKHVAIKIISKVKAPAEYIQKFLPREIDTVKGLHHENLIMFYQSIETSHR